MVRKAFGGMTVSFANCGCSAKDIFGTAPMAPSMMTKKLWQHVKGSHGGLMKK